MLESDDIRYTLIATHTSDISSWHKADNHATSTLCHENVNLHLN